MIRHHGAVNSARSPQWFDAAHQADILAAFDAHLTAGLHERHHSGPRPERVRELGQLAAASALPAAVRGQLLTCWYGGAEQRSTAA